MIDRGPSLTRQMILDICGNDLPKSVRDEIMEQVIECDLTQNSFIRLDPENSIHDATNFPLTTAFIRSQNVKRCVILVWW